MGLRMLVILSQVVLGLSCCLCSKGGVVGVGLVGALGVEGRKPDAKVVAGRKVGR